MLEHDSTGEGEPPLVIVPGGLTGWVSFLPLLPALSEHRRVVRVQPVANAEGAAGKAAEPSYDTDVERESIRRTLAAAGVGELHLLGWSNGGRAALDFALAHPDGIRSVTAIEPAAWWLFMDEDEEARRFASFMSRLACREVSEEELGSIPDRRRVRRARHRFPRSAAVAPIVSTVHRRHALPGPRRVGRGACSTPATGARTSTASSCARCSTSTSSARDRARGLSPLLRGHRATPHARRRLDAITPLGCGGVRIASPRLGPRRPDIRMT